MRKNLYDRILKWKPKEQHLRTVPKSCSKVLMLGSWHLVIGSGTLEDVHHAC